MITVTLSHPNGQRQEVLLAGVPRVGETIRLRNGFTNPSLLVESITWMQGDARDPEPTVLIIVRPRDEAR